MHTKLFPLNKNQRNISSLTVDSYLSVQEILLPQKLRGYKTKPWTNTESAETVLQFISHASHVRSNLTFSSNINHCSLNGSFSKIKNISICRYNNCIISFLWQCSPTCPRQLYCWGFVDHGDRGGTVVKVLCYKSEGRWFDPSWCQWNFLWHKILPLALWPWGGRLSL